MKKYMFVLENANGRISGHAYTLLGIKHIFKKVTNAHKCSVYKKISSGKMSVYADIPFVTYQKNHL